MEASMGPRHRCRGSHPARVAIRLEQTRLASMGPRHRCRGSLVSGFCDSHCDLLQWGRDIAVADRANVQRVMRSRKPTLQWGRDIAVADRT
jgi:hypothetical protein